MKHAAIVTGGGRPKDERLKWTNTGLGNIKSAIIGTCRSCDPQHTERYLAAFEYRFNRRFELDKMVERLARVAVQTAPKPYRSIAAVRSGAETPGRVEERRGGLGSDWDHHSVSSPRSSNAACGFPALRSPTGFTSRHTACHHGRSATTPSSPRTVPRENFRVPRPATL
jgi:hypothetical protein